MNSTRQNNFDLIIIGSGIAAYTVAKDWRELNATGSICLLTKDKGDHYSKPMLSNVIKQTKVPQDLCMHSAIEMAEKYNLTIMTETEVTQIDHEINCIYTANDKLTYKNLVLALGADTIRPPFKGDAASEVYHVNNLYDYAEFYTAVCSAESVAVIGSGLVGCEFVNDILSINKKIDLFSMESYPLARLVVPEVGAKVQAALEKHKVNLHFNATVKAIDRVDGKIQITYLVANAERKIMTDVVLSAVGIKPNTALAAAAGIKVNAGGIVTDKHGRTNCKNIYAIGDCANTAGFTGCYIAPILLMAKVIAKNIAGDNVSVEFPPMPIVVKFPICPVALLPLWRTDIKGEWRIEELEDGTSATFHDEHDRVIAFALTENMVNYRRELIQTMDPAIIYNFE
jgi:rubredoxin-NAD+ reductase